MKIGSDSPALWCWHYFLEDPSQKAAVISELEAAYGGDVQIHENTWPGLFGIIAAMRALVAFMYGTAGLFILAVTAMTSGRILTAEQRDIGIYKAMGFTGGRLRFSFALRFGMAALPGTAAGLLLAAVFTDPLVGSVMKLAGISNFSSSPKALPALLPAMVIIPLFMGFAYLAAGKINRTDLTELIAE